MVSESMIIKYRKEGWGISRLLRKQVFDNPFLDQLVSLANILRILNKENIAVSRGEVLTALNQFYKKEYHGDKGGYLNWLYREFQIKDRTKIRPHRTISNNKTPSTIKDNLLEGNSQGVMQLKEDLR